MAILYSARTAADLWGTPCIYLHFKIVLSKLERLGDKLKSYFLSLVSTGDYFLNCHLVYLQYWPVNLFISLEIAEIITI